MSFEFGEKKGSIQNFFFSCVSCEGFVLLFWFMVSFFFFFFLPFLGGCLRGLFDDSQNEASNLEHQVNEKL